MANEKKIKILPGGPYQVDGDVPLRQAVIAIDGEGTSLGWAAGKTYPGHPGPTGGPDEPVLLCRCGHSQNKPYCDGAHLEVGFEGEETAPRAAYRAGCAVYEGDGLDLLDNESLCASLRFCERAQGVWQAAIDSADPASRELAIEEACACAAGRLTVVDKATGRAIERQLPQEISPIADTAARWLGPLWVKGGIPIEGADGEMYETRNRVTLCRCGESANLPFCDTSHLRCPHMMDLDE